MKTTAPLTLNATETRIATAMHTQSFGFRTHEKVVRPGAAILKSAFSGFGREAQFRAFQGIGDDASQVLEWLTLVVCHLSENQVQVPTRPAHVTTWEEALAEVRNLTMAKFALANAEAQEELEESPAQFAFGDAVVVDGKVVDAWGPALSGPVFWWLENATLVGTWLVFQAVSDAATNAVSEGLASWTFSDTDGACPRKAAHAAFRSGMQFLDSDIRAALALVETAKAA